MKIAFSPQQWFEKLQKRVHTHKLVSGFSALLAINVVWAYIFDKTSDSPTIIPKSPPSVVMPDFVKNIQSEKTFFINPTKHDARRRIRSEDGEWGEGESIVKSVKKDLHFIKNKLL